MGKFPLFFESTSKATSGISNTWTSEADALSPVPVAIPPEFGGPGGGYSPEDLFAMACINCIIATFKVYAEHGNLQFQEITAKASLSVDKHPSENFLSMVNLDITLDVTGSSDKEKMEATLKKAIQDCPVSNSIKSGKTFHVNIH